MWKTWDMWKRSSRQSIDNAVCGVSREVTLQCIAVCQCVECLKAAVNILGDNVSALV